MGKFLERNQKQSSVKNKKDNLNSYLWKKLNLKLKTFPWGNLQAQMASLTDEFYQTFKE